MLDGREARVPGYDRGNFLSPTVLDGVSPESGLSNTEIFGPVLSLIHAGSVEEAIEIIARNPYGNASSIFTGSGATARKFRYDVPTGNVGVNVGVAAPMAYFPFSGWKDSFLGVMHGQGCDAIEFYTDKLRSSLNAGRRIGRGSFGSIPVETTETRGDRIIYTAPRRASIITESPLFSKELGR